MINDEIGIELIEEIIPILKAQCNGSDLRIYKELIIYKSIQDTDIWNTFKLNIKPNNCDSILLSSAILALKGLQDMLKTNGMDFMINLNDLPIGETVHFVTTDMFIDISVYDVGEVPLTLDPKKL